MCDCTSASIDELAEVRYLAIVMYMFFALQEFDQIGKFYGDSMISTTSHGQIDYATFWSTAESTPSLFSWATQKEETPFPFDLRDVQKTEFSFTLIAIASVLNVFYFCESLDTHPWELCSVC